MKTTKLLLLLLAVLSISMAKAQAQPAPNFEREWRKVDSLVARNLPQSALAEVRKIYAGAKKAGKDAQVIKSLVYLTGLQQQTREENEAQSIKEIEKELASAKEPAASILKSLQAQVYRQYYNRNRWNLYNRTNTASFHKEDLATWTTEDFHHRISGLYLQSLRHEKLLQATKLAPFEPIILKGNVRHLRPTLYDLLAHEALQYFQIDEREIKRPAYAFEIDQAEAFAPAATFASAAFSTKDSLSLKHKALLVYQELIRFHLGDAKPDALLDADIQRIQYVHRYSVHPAKDSLYLQALEKLTATYGRNPVAAQAWYLVAAHYEGKARQYEPLKDTAHRYDRVKAKEILEGVVRDSAVKSEGWANSYNLLQEINHSTFSFEVEKVNVPAQPFRALVRYKNTPALYFRLIKADPALKEQLQNRQDDQYWTALLEATPLKSWTQTLPPTNDWQQHSVEVKIDALPVGSYILLASPTQQFHKKSAPLGAQLFAVSNISYINQGSQFFVLHRESGQPLNKAAVTVYERQYDYKTYRYTKRDIGSFTTDRNGHFKLPKQPAGRSNGYYLHITHDKDQLNQDDLIYHYHNTDRNAEPGTPIKRLFLFTDRSIYRPGQTVYFKGIALTTQEGENNIATGQSTTIYLFGANGELVDSLQLTTNEFGSLNGTFQLPRNVLNGEFRLGEKEYSNSISFSVEEYKRPKFYVEFQKIQDSYRAGDSITVKGSAKAYAGNVVGGAKVAYRVVREARFLYPWLFWRWLPRTQPMEIAHGEITTAGDGSFSLTFKAIPDRSIDKKMDPVFDYRIYADVTDINGETRSGEQLVTAGYKSLVLKLEVPERLTADSLKTIALRTENMAGAFQPATVTLTITKLVPESRLIRQRYWEQPDQYVMSKEEYIRLFPHDEYAAENDYRTWQRGQTVHTTTDSTRLNARFPITATLAPGFYVLEVATRDKEGNEVKDLRHIEVYDPAHNGLARPQYLWAKGSGGPIEPGEGTSIQLGSSASAVFLIQQVEKGGDKEPADNRSFISLNNEKKRFEFSATEEDRGGFGVNYVFVRDNRVHQFADIISVPWSNKELKVEYATFRDKTLPGSEEQWKVRITGYKNDKVAAEMLAGMYDASLDQFRPHEWSAPGIWPVFARTLVWNGAPNFSAIQSEHKWVDERDYRQFPKVYDQLLLSHYRTYSFDGNQRINLRGAVSKSRRELSEAVMTDSATPVTAPTSLQGAVPGVAVENQEAAAGDREEREAPPQGQDIQVRRNFNETAFFFPALRTDKDGAIELSFTAPEALTRWKLQTLAHTKDLAFGASQKELVTQKELMVQPNAPRFLRQGDRIELSVKIVNLSARELTGQAELQLVNATTGESVDGWFLNTFPNQYFTVAAGQSQAVTFPIEVPYQFTNALVWRVIARAENFSDGEEAALPVLTNKTLVTETLPLPVRGSGTKNFTFDKLLQAASSETLQHHALTVEYTANPAWHAVQALPYLAEHPHECADQLWNRYYANSLAAMIVKAAPRVRAIFDRWKTADTAALLSNLQQNEELKSALLRETPWVLQAQSEEQQRKNIALLFDGVRMSRELETTMQQLKEAQSENGGFVWLKGGPDDRYITQYIVTGIGHLKKLGAIAAGQEEELAAMVSRALKYLDKKTRGDYDQLIKNKADLKQQHIGYTQVQYLYLRSFFPGQAVAKEATTAYNYFSKQAQQFWTRGNLYMQGMTGLSLFRTGDSKTAAAILKSLKETAIVNEEQGMYWKGNSYGRGWYLWQAPIETQALLIEAFSEVGKDTKTVDDLRTWLLKNKQATNWRTTRATAEACYALLLQGTNWLSSDPVVRVTLGNTTVSSSGEKGQAGTGYFKKTIQSSFIQPAMGNISVTVQPPTNQSTNQPSQHNQPINTPSWGAVYWQYFEDMDKITPAATPLQLTKKLFVEQNTDRGPVLTPVEEGTPLAVGTRLKVRIELRADRDMEYLHLKDMRASGLEPVNVLSGYKWQGGLGYYETTQDASTSFFIPYLRKGTYVLEYPLFVTHAGTFSNGITTIQSLYAPEFSAHSQGVRITVEAP